MNKNEIPEQLAFDFYSKAIDNVVSIYEYSILREKIEKEKEQERESEILNEVMARAELLRW